jgi:phosphomannomutase
MEQVNWKKLQNGSDIRGVAIDGVKGEPVNLTPQVVFRLGQAFVYWLKSKSNKSRGLTVSVGRDSRLSGPELAKELMEGLKSAGADVLDFGLASTPAMFMSTRLGDRPVDGAIMLTASHLPYNRNGLKFFTAGGGLDKADISSILEIAENTKMNGELLGKQSSYDFMAVYSDFLVGLVRREVNHPLHFDTPLKGLKIVVDAGNGSGGFYAQKVLAPLGADVSDSQFLDPDGRFPNHVPNPEDATAMESVSGRVKEAGADLGVIFDTDVDRAALVDNTGRPINRNALIALSSAMVLQEHPGSTIVTDSITSDGLARFIQDDLGGRHHRFQRGYKNVINESIRLNSQGTESWLAIETSGHAALKENFFLDDGAYLATKLIVTLAKMRAQGKKLTDLIKNLSAPLESNELRLKINKEDFRAIGEQVIGELGLMAGSKSDWDLVPNNFEGVRVSCSSPEQKGWFLLRLSLHDPVLPLNIESEVEGGVQKIAAELFGFLNKYELLDLSAFKRFGL